MTHERVKSLSARGDASIFVAFFLSLSLRKHARAIAFVSRVKSFVRNLIHNGATSDYPFLLKTHFLERHSSRDDRGEATLMDTIFSNEIHDRTTRNLPAVEINPRLCTIKWNKFCIQERKKNDNKISGV